MKPLDFEALKDGYRNINVEYLRRAGIVPDVFEDRHIRCILPAAPQHLNPDGTVCWESIYCLAESVAGFLLVCTHGPEYVVIIKSLSLEILSSAKTDVVADARLDEKEAEEKISYIREHGRGQYPVSFALTDRDGNVLARACVVCYVLGRDSAGFSSKKD